jgi:hypothetical protein
MVESKGKLMASGRTAQMLSLSGRTGHHWADKSMRRLGWRVSIALALSCVLVVLIPIAHAAPPDPTWIDGIYDAEDYDDVVVLVGLFEGLAEDGLGTAGSPVATVATLTAGTHDGAGAAEHPRRAQPRAPPQP